MNDIKAAVMALCPGSADFYGRERIFFDHGYAKAKFDVLAVIEAMRPDGWTAQQAWLAANKRTCLLLEALHEIAKDSQFSAGIIARRALDDHSKGTM